MTFAERTALDRVIRTDNSLPQRDVEAADRPAFTELLRQGLIEEEVGAWSGRSYWVTTTAGRREWARHA